MKLKQPMWLALAAAALGIAILAAWFPQYWPGTYWTVIPREQAITKARGVARQFGFDTHHAHASVTASVSQPLAFYFQHHQAEAQTISPLTMRIKLEAGDDVFTVGLDSAGRPTYWQAPDNYKSAHTASSESDAALRAFQILSGSTAPSFTGPSKSMGDDPKDEVYVWKKNTPEHSELREEIKVTANGPTVTRAERKVSLASDVIDDDTGDPHEYWGVLTAIFWTLCTICSIAVIVIYLLWLSRRTLNQRFPLILAALSFAAMITSLIAAGGEVSVGEPFFASLLFLSFVAVGRAISPAARPKWMSLEHLCFLAPLAKSTGDSILAGVLCSPLLVAIPFLIAGCGLFPQSSVLARNLEILYGRVPLLQSLNVANSLYVLVFFGFAVPVLRRLFRYRWLHWAVVLPIGTAFFACVPRVISGPIAAPLTAGFCTLLLSAFLYKYFDLLAVVTVQLTSGFLLSAWILGQKNESFVSLAVAFLTLLAAAYVITQRGHAIAEGDPRATTPPLTGFHGEREKLQAEFSVARRAQQGMLPAAPPTIPGYSIAASCTPSLDVGGDLYDFLELPDGRIGIGVADVSGKGVPAALYMTLTKGLLASVSQDSSELADVVEQVNRHLHAVTRKKVFVTMALGFLDAPKRILQCVRAGHNPIVWRQASANVTTLVAPTGLGMGITAGRVFRTQLKMEELHLSEGDAVVFYSDGITEAMNRNLEQFGEQRLMDVVAQIDHGNALATHDAILHAVRAFLDGVHPQDDMTLVVLRVGDERMMVSG